MFWTWDAAMLRRTAGTHDDPLASFLTKVDELLYAAAAALAVCVIALMIG